MGSAGDSPGQRTSTTDARRGPPSGSRRLRRDPGTRRDAVKSTLKESQALWMSRRGAAPAPSGFAIKQLRRRDRSARTGSAVMGDRAA
jgi:hypothetical protein